MRSVSTSRTSPTLTKIPVLPISYGGCAAAARRAARSRRAGALARRASRHVSLRPRSGARAHAAGVQLESCRVYNVIARMQGSTFPDEWVIRGNHHDAWVNGAQDPGSGMSVVLEEARALGELAKQGWRPKRTLVYAAWDGEEQALLGSTEWVEDHDKDLREHAVAYVNSDGTDAGSSTHPGRIRSSSSSTRSRATSRIRTPR